jgi:alpha-L-fucosidase
METLQDYRTKRELILMLIDIVSRGGNLLLDIGPTADGRIPVIMEERLTEIGNWLRPNAEAIYGTHRFERSYQWSKGSIPRMEDKQFMAAYDITKLVDIPPAGYARTDAFFTAKNDTVYAFLPRWPESEMWFEDLVPRHTAKVTFLESGDELRWQLHGSRLRVEVPESLRSKVPHREVYVLKMVGVGGP